MSTIAVALSTVTILKTSQLGAVPDLLPDLGYSSCGNHNPSAYCLSRTGFTLTDGDVATFGILDSDDGLSIITLSYVLLTILAMDFLWNPEKPVFVPLREWLIARIGRQQAAQGTTSKTRQLLKAVVWTVYISIYLLIWTLYGLFFIAFFTNLAALHLGLPNVLDTRTWSFGQIVTITIWLAPISEWVYLEFRKYIGR